MTGSKLRFGLAFVLVVLVGVGLFVVMSGEPEPLYETGPGAVPDGILQRAITEAESYDGKVDDVYQQARTSLAYLRDVEPSNTLGLDEPEDADVYAVFFEGDFVVHSPPSGEDQPSVSKYRAGRVLVVDKTVLSVQLWKEPKESDPPFGPRFDDA